MVEVEEEMIVMAMTRAKEMAREEAKRGVEIATTKMTRRSVNDLLYS